MNTETDVSGNEREPHEHYFRADGTPSPGLLGVAVQVWSAMHPDKVTIGDAAQAFHTTAEVIAEAVEEHYWLFTTGKGPLADRLIQHEGE
jgi:hypothetical protein